MRSPSSQIARAPKASHCVYPILLSDEKMIRAFVEAVGIINIMCAEAGRHLAPACRRSSACAG